MLLPRRHVRVGAFDHLFGLGRGGFEQKFSKNSNAWGGVQIIPIAQVKILSPLRRAKLKTAFHYFVLQLRCKQGFNSHLP